MLISWYPSAGQARCKIRRRNLEEEEEEEEEEKEEEKEVVVEVDSAFACASNERHQ